MHSQINQLLVRAIQSFQSGKFDEAEQSLYQVLKSQPKNFDALHILGVLKGSKNQHKEALEFFRKALRIDQNNSSLNFNIAKAFSENGEEDKALKYHLIATKLNPTHPEAWLNFGKSLSNINKHNESLGCYIKALDLRPEYSEAWTNRGCVLMDLGQYVEALASFDESLKINPHIAEAWSNRGNLLQELKQYQQALGSHDKAISIKPDYAEAWSNHGVALSELHQYEQALGSYDKAISIKPDYAQAWSNRGNVFFAIGQFELGVVSYREAICIDPNYLMAHSNLLQNLNYLDSLNPENALEEAKCYGLKVSQRSIPKFTEWNAPIATEKLKIGFVSGDLRNHSVGYFIESLIECLDKTLFEIFAFPTVSTKDDLTNRLLPFLAEWVPIYGKSDFEAASVIHQKGIHVLIDLSGHTAHNRLAMFSHKPAPVQVSWLGLPMTTGVPEMDYVLGDPHALPQEFERQFTEAIWRLPESYLCLTKPYGLGQVEPLPAQTNGYITFGSFNNLSKINNSVVEVWSSILKALPNAKLLLKTKQLSDPNVRTQTQKRFGIYGVTADRLLFKKVLDSRNDHLAVYNEVDIALDTFPYPGVTTSAEGYWMGVPVLALEGNSFLSSTATSIANSAGLNDWVASDVNDYFNKAIQFASDLERLALLRSSLRDRVLKSPLFDSPRFAKNFGDALRGMWNQHSQSKAEHIEE